MRILEKIFTNSDKYLLVNFIVLLIVGLTFFSSALLGIYDNSPIKFFSVLQSQLVYGLGAAIILFLIALSINYKIYYRASVFLFIIAIILCLLVFIPGLQMYHGGAHRWVEINGFTFQPAEIMKYALVLLSSAYLIKFRDKLNHQLFGFWIPLITIALIGGLIMAQPDFGSTIIILGATFIIYFIASKRNIYPFIIAALGIIGFITLLYLKPYMMDRMKTFLDPEHDPTGSSWQLIQSQIAIGNGGLFGRGLGQSVQKFGYLPEAVGDSVFSVMSEEIGFVGNFIFIILLISFISRGFIVAMMVNEKFGRYLMLGILLIFTIQTIVNICSMIGLLPLTGVPLPLMSHGGTALAMTSFGIGVLLNISKSKRV